MFAAVCFLMLQHRAAVTSGVGYRGSCYCLIQKWQAQAQLQRRGGAPPHTLHSKTNTCTAVHATIRDDDLQDTHVQLGSATKADRRYRTPHLRIGK